MGSPRERNDVLVVGVVLAGYAAGCAVAVLLGASPGRPRSGASIWRWQRR
jgi:hypothetical protein